MKTRLVKVLISFASACAATLALCAPPSAAQRPTGGAGSQEEARPAPWTGCFYEAVGGRPKGLEEFENFFVSRFPGQPVSGGLVTKATSLVYTFSEAEVAGDRLTFTTVARRGVKYGFEGRLLREGSVEGGGASGEAVAEGTLRKYRRGRRVAEARVRLRCGEAGEGVD